MFRSKIIMSTAIFILLLIITSIIKNQTRITEKKIYKLSQKITLKQRDVNESQLDFYFLTSPAELEKRVETLGLNNYVPIENSKIFLSFNIFTNVQKKISAFDNYDKKNKKN